MDIKVHDYYNEYDTIVRAAEKIFSRINACELTFKKTSKVKYNDNAIKLKEIHKNYINRLRKITNGIDDPIFFRDAKTLLAVPSKKLEKDEFLIHRIWLGDSIKDSSKSSLAQWGSALCYLENKTKLVYKSILWVWDEGQLINDCFFERKKDNDQYTIGIYHYHGGGAIVKSLDLLIKKIHSDNEFIYHYLHERSCYCILSDIFRLSVINAYGGIYVDCDTIPHRTIMNFIINPEVPSYYKTNITTQGFLSRSKISWMNFYKDENGALVTTKNNDSISSLIGQIDLFLSGQFKSCVLKGLSQDTIKYLHASVYEIWRREIGYTLYSYYEVQEKFSTLSPAKSEAMISGIKGARITKNHVDNVYLPLSKTESMYFNSCLYNLESLNWELKDINDLEQYAEIEFITERPRVLYHPQLRHRNFYFNFYSFMSEDINLNRLNDVFCKYVINKLDGDIAQGNYWTLPGNMKNEGNTKANSLVNISSHDYAFINADSLKGKHFNQMAKLIFSTSYLEYCSHSNKLNLPFTELQKRQNILPYIKLTKGVVNREGDIVAFSISGAIDDYDLIPSTSIYRDEMELMDKKYDHFLDKNKCERDFFISTICVAPQYRNKGIFNSLLNCIKKTAIGRNSRRITLTVWESNEALDIYINKGFEIIDYSEFAYEVFFDRILFLSLDLE